MKKNKIWIPILAAGLVVTICAGMLLLPLLPGRAAAVYPVTMVGYTDFYSGSAESFGMVTTDKVQTVYLSGTQTVTEIKVHPGQKVKMGDVLFTYDTTLSDLAIERKDLANQQLEVSLKTAKAELTALNKMKPIVYKPGSGSSTTATDYTKSPSDRSKLNTVYSTKTTGKSKSSPLYMWLQTSKEVDNDLIEYLFSQASGNLDYIYVVFQMTSGNRANTEFNVQTGVKFTRDYEITTPPTDPTPGPSDPTGPSDPSDPSDPSTPSEPSEPTEPSSEPTEPSSEPTAPSSEPTEPTSEPTEATEPTSEPTTPTTEETEPSEPPADLPTPAGIKELKGYSMTFFTPPSAPKEDSGTVEWNDGYTSAELTALRAEKREQIKQLEFDIKMGKAELKIMKKEADSGQVTATFSGTVSDILDPAQALETGEPLMKISGGGGYYVDGTISELALDTIFVGQTVTVTSWDTGMVCTGQIREIGSYPSDDQSDYYGSANETYYPYRVFVDQSADLMEGSYVSMTYQTPQQAAGILYLQNAFIRTEGNRSYVYARSAEGLLEKRYLECGVSTDGYMTPIYGGITEEDYLAFPYGKEVKIGASTYEGTDQDLYGY